MFEQANPRSEHTNADETYRDEHPADSAWLTEPAPVQKEIEA